MHQHIIWEEGRLTGEPTCRKAGQYDVANFSIAITSRNSKEGKEEVCFLDCAAWRDLALLVRDYCHKGTLILIAGRLTLNEWKDRDGKPRKKLELVADEIGLSLRMYQPARASSGPPDDSATDAPSAATRKPRRADSVDPTPAHANDPDAPMRW